ncbi:uncharacterized protein LOC108741568 [Agrilus planipennis]|uniref:Uncharacterized protein LOC108741568 n=1 Tax=Agrilus planipennis TaxID=224129 RepID=A0A1W4X799_AGRPL|nr:uncharacterized protein LOC108741568 [Agrilus planipennis]
MKIAVVLLLVCLLVLLNVSTSESSHHHEEKKGAAKKVSHHDGHNDEKKSGKKSGTHAEVARKGHSTHDLHRVDDEEKGGKKKKYHSSDKYAKGYQESGHDAHAGAFKLGGARFKGNYKKGFLEKYHKNEKNAHDSFFSKAEKGGDFQIFGSKNNRFQSQKYDRVEEGKHKAGKTGDEAGKKGKKASGHNEKVDKKYKQEGGSKSQHAKHESYGKKDHKSAKTTHHIEKPPK